MPIQMFAQTPVAAPANPNDPNNLAQVSVGAQKSQMLADLLMKQALGQDRLPGSTLEGVSRVFNAGLGGYEMNQANQYELQKRQALIQALGGNADPLSAALIASGDKEGINSVVQARIADARLKAEREYQEQQTAAQNKVADERLSKTEAFTASENQKNRDANSDRMQNDYDYKLKLFQEEQKIKNGEGGKDLTNNDIKRLAPLGEGYNVANGYSQTFKPEYGGYGMGLGGIAQTMGKYYGTNLVPGAMPADAENFWTAYQSTKNEVRKQLFGSALTATEKAEWDKADITPDMPPDLIAWNLERRRVAAYRAVLKQGRQSILEGKNPQQVMGQTGLTLDELQGNDMPDYPKPLEQPGAKPAGTVPGKATGRMPTQAAPTGAATALPPVTVDQGTAAVSAPISKQLPNGSMAYQDPKTGKWYDNPELK